MTRKIPSLLILVAMIGLSVYILAAPSGCKSGADSIASAAQAEATPTAAPKKAEYQPAAPEIADYRAKGLPMLLDFGRGFCIPCKKMAPDLEALHTEMAGKVLVRFNDLAKETELAQKYKIRVMPTQIYIDAKDNEVFRHEGYASKADMLEKMKALGFI